MNVDWFRSWHGAPTDTKWLAVARRAGVPAAVVSAIAWALFDHASQAAERGSVEGFDVESYTAFAGVEEAAVHAVIAAMRDKGVIVEGRLASWARRQPLREDSSTGRMRALRTRRRVAESAEGVAVTPCDASAEGVTQCDAREEERREEETREEKTSSLPARRAGRKASRIPEDWQADIAAAKAEGLSESEAQWEAQKFRDYWRAKPGAAGVKADWPAMWRNWCRTVVERHGRAGGGGSSEAQAPPGQVWVKFDTPTWRAIARVRRANGRAAPAHYHSPIHREDGAWLRPEEVAAAEAPGVGEAA